MIDLDRIEKRFEEACQTMDFAYSVQDVPDLVSELRAARAVIEAGEDILQEFHIDFAQDGLRFPALETAIKTYRKIAKQLFLNKD